MPQKRMKKSKIEMINNNLSQERGITLVALVVTIIVLLILAGVTLSLIGGSEGILGRTTHAVDENEKAMAKEQAELSVADYQTEFYEAKYVDRTNNGTKKEYILEKLQGETYTEKYKVVTSEEGKVKVYDKNGVSKNPIVTGNVQEDGSIKWDDEVETGTPDEPKKENPVTVTLNPEYVGTSSFTIKMNASSTEGNIVSYQYQINGGEVKTTTENTFTIEDLEPTTNYTISVVAMDEKGNENKTSIEVTTKARTYIIKNGIPQIQGQALRSTGTQENGYFKILTDSTVLRAAYYFVSDLTNYKTAKADMEVINKGSFCSISFGFWLINDNIDTCVTWQTMPECAHEGSTLLQRTTVGLSVKDFLGFHNIMILKSGTIANGAGASSATCHIYNLWLEE